MMTATGRPSRTRSTGRPPEMKPDAFNNLRESISEKIQDVTASLEGTGGVLRRIAKPRRRAPGVRNSVDTAPRRNVQLSGIDPTAPKPGTVLGRYRPVTQTKISSDCSEPAGGSLQVGSI